MALAIDSQETSHNGHRTTGAGSVTLTWSFTNTAGNLLLVGVVVTDAATAITAPTATYNGVSMTAGPNTTWASSASWGGLFYLASPATGANTVSVNTTGLGSSGAMLGGAISFSGALSTLGTTSTNNDAGGTGTHATAGSITAASGNYVLGVGGWGSGAAATADHNSTFALVGSGNTGGDDIATDYALSSGAAINTGFTWTSADHWGMVAAEIKAAASASTTPLRGAIVSQAVNRASTY